MNNAASARTALPLCAAALAALALMVGHAQAGPIEISAQPATAMLDTGDPLDVAVAISGLDNDDLGGFDLSLAFDPVVLRYQSYSLGMELADPIFGVYDLSDDSDAPSGLLQLAEAATLIDLTGQPDAFVLATVSFIALRPGTTALTLSSIGLFDDLGDPLAVDTVSDASATVPLPSTLLLMPAGIGLLQLRRRRACRS